jgi:glycosyltransferase involved in cell wall biosynthesis
MKHSLTIGIPAFNLERTISKTITSVLNQIDEVKNICDVEILISDNCSTDKTASIIKQHQKEYSDVISYYKQKTNLGFSKNVANIFNKAKGEYVWLCGDDIFLSSALLNFCDALKNSKEKINKNPAVILTKSMSSDDVALDNPKITYQEECSDNNLVYENIFHLRNDAKAPIILACFMSVTIISKQAWVAVKELNLEGDYIHTEAVWKITKEKPIVVIDKFCILAQEASWTSSKSAEFQAHAPISYLLVLKDVFGNFDMLRKIDKKRAKNHIFGAILSLQKRIKHPKNILSAIVEIDFFPKFLLSGTKFISKINNILAFRFLVFCIKADKALRKSDILSLYNAVIVTLILIMVILK